jgi:hypothetical protein
MRRATSSDTNPSDFRDKQDFFTDRIPRYSAIRRWSLLPEAAVSNYSSGMKFLLISPLFYLS